MVVRSTHSLILAVFITIVYFVNWGFTSYGIGFGSVRSVKPQMGVDEDMMKKEREQKTNGVKADVWLEWRGSSLHRSTLEESWVPQSTNQLLEI